MSDEIRFDEEQTKILQQAPVPDDPEKLTFYCAVENKPSNQQIPVGGEKIQDSAGRVMSAPGFRLIQFSEGIYRTADEIEIKTLRRLARDVYTGITEDREAYLAKVIPPEKQLARLQEKLDQERREVNRLRDELTAGGNRGVKVVTGAIGTGSVPRRVLRQQ